MHQRTPIAVEQPLTAYGGDVARWAQEQAAAIAAGRWADVDIVNVAEEIDALGISQWIEIRSRLRVLMAHLLKPEHQPERATPSWHDTIVEQAVCIDEVVLASPSLRREMPALIAYAYPRACRLAAKETGIPLSTFPKAPTRHSRPRWPPHSSKTNPNSVKCGVCGERVSTHCAARARPRVLELR